MKITRILTAEQFTCALFAYLERQEPTLEGKGSNVHVTICPFGEQATEYVVRIEFELVRKPGGTT